MLRAAIFPGDNAVRHLGHVMLFCTICTVYVKSAAIAREEESSSTGMTNRATHQLTANEEDTKIGNDSIILENDTRDFEYAKNVTAEKKNESSVENWCVIWYLGAFGSLVSFFLIITCTELFFGNPLYRRENIEAYVQQFHTSDHIKPWKPQTPPPPYRLFAPPGYKETMKKYKKEQSSKPVSPSIYIIPVHTKTNSSSTTVEKKK